MDVDVEKSYNISNPLTQEKMANNGLYERFMFNSRNQLEGETLDNYVQKLRQLVEKCNFSENINRTILDRLICGVKDKRIQSYLLQEGKKDTQELTVEKALEI